MLDLFSGAEKLEPLTREQHELLAAQKIDDLNPGTIVHDFQVLLDYDAQHELPVAGKLGLLPMNILHDLSGRIHEPLVAKLQRPQLKSYPNLQQLYPGIEGWK